MKYEDFRVEQINLQLAWRQRHPEISTDYGFQNGRPYAHIVPKSEWEKTIWGQIRCPLLEYLKKEYVQHHLGTHNLLSSWVLCSNLYFGTNTDAGLKELFRLFLQEKLNIKIEVINEVYIEFALDGKLSPAKLLGEPEGKRGANQTSPDVAVSFTTNGKNGLILIECKYTEHSFYECSGKDTDGRIPNPDPGRCLSKNTLNKLVVFQKVC